MPVELVSGDIFESGCEALVNPVDCTGAQGAGLAKAFMRRYRAQSTWFKRHGAKGYTKPGQVYFVLPPGASTLDRRGEACRILALRRALGAEPLVLFATTKLNWRYESNIDWVRRCAEAIVEVVSDLQLVSVAVPALGCGEGGLAWDEVRPRLRGNLASVPTTCRVRIYEPHEPAARAVPRRRR